MGKWRTVGGLRKPKAWKAAFITGLMTSTFSTIVILLGNGRLGRDNSLTWMEVATIPLRDNAITTRPGWRQTLAGILTHQFADVVWASLFFGLGNRWTSRLRPKALFPALPGWAALTAALEYYLILPWLQPIVLMQNPYWVGLLAHVSSASAYPLFYLARDGIANRRSSEARFARRWAAGLVGMLAPLGVLAALGRGGREVPWPFTIGRTRNFDRAFMRRMAAHHEVGVRLAELAARKSHAPELRVLGRLMIYQQQVEIEALRRWWASWFGGSLPPVSQHEHETMPGMPPHGTVEALAALGGPAFDARFVDVMTAHHWGAVHMSHEAMKHAVDPRLRVFADSIRHSQRKQIARMSEGQVKTRVFPPPVRQPAMAAVGRSGR